MKHLLRAALPILIALPLASPLASAESLDTVLSRLDAASKTTNSFSANLKQTDYTAILDDAAVTTGKIQLMRAKQGVVGIVDFGAPNPNTVHFTGKTVEKYYPASKNLEVYDLGKEAKFLDQYLLLGFGTAGSQLKKDYDIQALGEETVAGVKATHLELMPKQGGDLSKLIKKVELWIPVGQDTAVQTRVTKTAGGDYLQYEYSNVKINPGLPASAYTFTPPAGTKRIELR